MCPATRTHVTIEEEINDANRARRVALDVHACSVAVPGGGADLSCAADPDCRALPGRRHLRHTGAFAGRKADRLSGPARRPGKPAPAEPQPDSRFRSPAATR